MKQSGEVIMTLLHSLCYMLDFLKINLPLWTPNGKCMPFSVCLASTDTFILILSGINRKGPSDLRYLEKKKTRTPVCDNSLLFPPNMMYE